MIIDELESEERGGCTTSSARLRWTGGEFRLELRMPAELAAPRPDASPFLCASILLAMRRGEDLEVRAPVSTPLLERVPQIVDRYAVWDPRLFRSSVSATAELAPAPRASGIGCFFSRGVDSTFSAASPRALPGRLTQLVFCDRLEPMHSLGVRQDEVRLAREAAARLDVPLALIESNIRELTDPIVRDWEDMAGAGLSFLATSMSGGLGHVVIPSSDGPKTIGPCGTSPLLDPLFSTAEVEIVHDAPGTRMAKIAWLARERPDLLPYLKVCFQEDRPDNCGHCSKCLLTVLALEATGRRREAVGFPAEIDMEALAAVRIRGPQPRQEFTEVEQALRARAGARDQLAELVAEGLARAAADSAETPLPDDSPAFRRRASRRRVSGPRAAVDTPRTTVMMPSYESEATLREAVISVLSQTVDELELVVVDDASTTPVSDVLADLRDPRLRILRHTRNRGLSAARNSALGAARAPLVSQLDADDLWEPDYLESVLPSFDDPAVGLVYSNCTILGHPAGHDDYIGDPSVHPMHDFPKIAEQNPVPSPTATMRALAVRGVGGYALWLRQCEDYHLYMKLARAGWRFAYVDKRLARYRWPEPGRGMSYGARRHALWEHAMYASFVVRHPCTPGPRRQLRVRARRELEHAVSVATRRLPAMPSPRPRLLVAPGSYAMLNLGDVAMVQVCVERLRSLWPDASIGVITGAPDRLAEHCPGVHAVPASGQDEWFHDRRAGIGRVPARLANGSTRAARLALRARLLAHEPASDDLLRFAGWLEAADGVVVSGRGGTTDVFLDDGLKLLELLRAANARGIPTAMFGQGLGPLEDRALRASAQAVLPNVEVLGVRERRAAVPLLHELGVPRDRVVLMGDDALELAVRMRSNHVARDAIGVSLRVAEYSGTNAASARAIGEVLRDAAARRGIELRAVPISLYPHEDDIGHLRQLIGSHSAAAATPGDALTAAGGCRVVVAGSYHAAVFALGQGVPVVGVSATPYYDAKLAGLADLFPGGCRVVAAGDPDFPARLAAAVDEAWETAEALAPALLAAAEQQVAAARAAYARFEGPVARRAGLNGAVSAPRG
ncbi:MAG TPA: glycosyltransferase [Thermoleophilaceae bacterium]|nr:glycosyltransferase [Thermoleophilaceae bacterium]